LRATHHAGRINCLVCGNHDEAFATVLRGGGGDEHRAANVVDHSLPWMTLTNRHVLVSGGVEDQFGPALAEYTQQRVSVRYITKLKLYIGSGILPMQIALNLRESVFRAIQTDEPCRPVFRDLPA